MEMINLNHFQHIRPSFGLQLLGLLNDLLDLPLGQHRFLILQPIARHYSFRGLRGHEIRGIGIRVLDYQRMQDTDVGQRAVRRIQVHLVYLGLWCLNINWDGEFWVFVEVSE